MHLSIREMYEIIVETLYSCQDGRLLDASASSPSPNLNTNSITRKAGGRKCPEKQMQVFKSNMYIYIYALL
jgi:hypothetical protein